MYIPSKRFISLLAGIPLLLMIPYVAMQFTNEVQWTASDFVVAFVLLVGIVASIEWTTQKIKNIPKRNLVLFGIAMTFIFIWLELAVGIIGSPFSGH